MNNQISGCIGFHSSSYRGGWGGGGGRDGERDKLSHKHMNTHTHTHTHAHTKINVYTDTKMQIKMIKFQGVSPNGIFSSIKNNIFISMSL